MGGLLLKKMAEIRHFFVFFWCTTGVLVFFCRCVCGVGLWWCVVGGAVCCWWFRFCAMWWGRADFRGIGCCRVRDGGTVGVCGDVWGVTGVGTVGVMDRGCAIKFSYGRAVVSVAVRFYCGGFV